MKIIMTISQYIFKIFSNYNRKRLEKGMALTKGSSSRPARGVPPALLVPKKVRQDSSTSRSGTLPSFL